ncbi:esterase/lipase family protein [Streptomyces smyrnaeus]|uniref:esterase/lipase family protein n=1 Tax=Streptomyces TaxID=1883 RepID=UPI0015D4FA6D|nr:MULTISPECIES: alpha/beta fold hydrolase [unclassified Streptomyces]MBQ0866219.1 alpha/beta fold hydrolase [Streptomyces sp. RK75]MBQ1121335.1 alpha/beta fold hydrolase [Streptomyces sp. B15]MBQ1158140.1 alpha/beta fold hydrolase [Streptomyces sp. A73]
MKLKPSALAPRRLRRSAATTAAMAVAVVALPAATVTAPADAASPDTAATSRTTGGWNDYSCKPSAAHPRPVVLVHGTFGNSVDNWLGLAPYLVERGYCVFSLDYGQLPGKPFFHGLGPIEDSAKQLAAYVDKVLAATGTGKVDIVGHSQGGMMPRQYLKFLGGAPKVNALIGIAPSNHGTTLSGLARLADQFPPIGDVVDEIGPALLQQKEGSDFLEKLNAGGDTVPGVEYTVIATRYDQVVTPYKTQFLDGPNVKNVTLQDLCPLNISEHLAVALADRMAWHETANALDPAHATPTTCLS